MQVLTRRQAIDRGLLVYSTGRPCGRNHLAMRFTNTGACRECVKLYAKNYQREYRQNVKARRMGHSILKLKIDPRDEKAIRDFAEAVSHARNY